MDKGQGPGDAGAVYTDRSCHSIAYGPYGWLLAGQPHAIGIRASGVPSSACELRWTLKMVADVEVMVVRPRPAVAAAGLASAVVPVLACNTSQ